LITEPNVKKILQKDLSFSIKQIAKLDNFVKYLLNFNKNRNLISKSTEKVVWARHILDSAQLTRFINQNECSSIADLGSGGGFPGIVLSIFYENCNFHVKLYEKSPVKSKFLSDIVKILGLKSKVISSDINSLKIDSNYIVCRAFKKLPQILNISRENCIKKHKMIIMKGRNAQEEINKASQLKNYKYKLEKSITDDDSRIIILNAD
tara:strand:- start:399 stop:1019 length:621 start_codon:yes stop_codon:yes gene_type:complete